MVLWIYFPIRVLVARVTTFIPTPVTQPKLMARERFTTAVVAIFTTVKRLRLRLPGCPPLSRIIKILKARSEGMSLNATARTFNVSKKSVIDWERRLAALKPTLMLYSVLHEFIHQEIEGDELYTKVDKNVPPSVSEGWTIVLMERGSRFLWEWHCGRKDKQLFEKA